MLTKNQIRYLRSLANTCENKYQIGKFEISDTVIDLLDKALLKHELIKVVVNQSVSDNKSDYAYLLSEALHCELIQIIGNVIVLYRKTLKEPKIILP